MVKLTSEPDFGIEWPPRPVCVAMVLSAPTRWDNFASAASEPVTNLRRGVEHVRYETGAGASEIIVRMHERAFGAVLKHEEFKAFTRYAMGPVRDGVATKLELLGMLIGAVVEIELHLKVDAVAIGRMTPDGLQVIYRLQDVIDKDAPVEKLLKVGAFECSCDAAVGEYHRIDCADRPRAFGSYSPPAQQINEWQDNAVAEINRLRAELDKAHKVMREGMLLDSEETLRQKVIGLQAELERWESNYDGQCKITDEVVAQRDAARELVKHDGDRLGDLRAALDEQTRFLAGLDERRWSKPDQEKRRALLHKSATLLRAGGIVADTRTRIAEAAAPCATRYGSYPAEDLTPATVRKALNNQAGKMFAVVSDQVASEIAASFATAADLERAGIPLTLTREQMCQHFGIELPQEPEAEVLVMPIQEPRK